MVYQFETDLLRTLLDWFTALDNAYDTTLNYVIRQQDKI